MQSKNKKSFPIVFYNVSNYDYHCIIEELTEEFERQFECLGENTEKFHQKKNIKMIKKQKIKSIDSVRFMVSSLSRFAEGLSSQL